MPDINVDYARYGPTPFDFRLGGNRYFDYTITFTGTPPATFDYTLNIQNEKDEISKTIHASSIPTNPDGSGSIHIAWDGTDNMGTPVSYGSYRPYISAEASGYTPLSNYGFCGGGNNEPPGGGENNENNGAGGDCLCDPTCKTGSTALIRA